jgi:predicted Fe-S protein YdhL (DUF1289 family)
MGCGRTLDEIVAWSASSSERKTEILATSRARAAAKAAGRNRR